MADIDITDKAVALTRIAEALARAEFGGTSLLHEGNSTYLRERIEAQARAVYALFEGAQDNPAVRTLATEYQRIRITAPSLVGATTDQDERNRVMQHERTRLIEKADEIVVAILG